MTATSATAVRASTASTSAGYTFSPPVMNQVAEPVDDRQVAVGADRPDVAGAVEAVGADVRI